MNRKVSDEKYEAYEELLNQMLNYEFIERTKKQIAKLVDHRNNVLSNLTHAEKLILVNFQSARLDYKRSHSVEHGKLLKKYEKLDKMKKYN